MTFKIGTTKKIHEKRSIIKRFNYSTSKNSLTDYLTELGFFGKDFFYCVLSKKAHQNV